MATDAQQALERLKGTFRKLLSDVRSSCCDQPISLTFLNEFGVESKSPDLSEGMPQLTETLMRCQFCDRIEWRGDIHELQDAWLTNGGD